jgi:REP element-mobilizing transposase RayT
MRFDFQNRYLDLYFTTATVKGWKHLLKPDKYKQIITNSMNFLVKEGGVWIYSFAIMPNHFHWIWQMKSETQLSHVQQRMMKFVAQQIKFDLTDHHPEVLEQFKVERKDRQYQFLVVSCLG